MPVFRLGVPQGRTFSQSQFGPTFAGFLLFAGQPIPQRWHQIVVRELIELRSGIAARFGLESLRIGGRNQPQFAVQNPQQVIEITWSV